jgi:hypothetical protein
MKKVVSVSLGSSKRDKRVQIDFKGVPVVVERIGTNGNIQKAQQLFSELDGNVDCLSVGGVDLALRLDGRAYPLYAARKLVKDVKQTPVVDGQGLKGTLERRVIELARPALGGVPHYKSAFMAMGVDRVGMARAICEVTDEVVFGDLMVGLGVPLIIKGFKNFRRVLKVMLPLVSLFPMSMIYYDSMTGEVEPKYENYWKEAELIAGDFLFMSKVLPHDLSGKTIITNTTTAENVQFLKDKGISTIITTTPRYDGRSFGTNMMEAVFTAYAGKGRILADEELNALIDDVDMRPDVIRFD